MLDVIIAGIGLGKLSEEVLETREEQESTVAYDDDQVGWSPEMDYNNEDEE